VDEQQWLTCTNWIEMFDFLKGSSRKRTLDLFFCACFRQFRYPLTDANRKRVERVECAVDGLRAADQVSAARSAARHIPGWSRPAFDLCPASEALRVALMREVCGNPFRPVAADPRWLFWQDGRIRQLAEAAYQERLLPSGHLDPDRLGVLADALEEAGCENPEILDHLRGPGPHVRGCWPVDLCLGKS
jgi:hypothetical protein